MITPIHKRKRAFALYSLVTTLTEEAVLVAVVLWVLPSFGINIPLWLLVAFTVAWGVWSYLMFRLGLTVIGKVPVVGAEALIGVRCRTTAPLSPDGYVRVGGELWLAHSMAGNVGEGSEVVIVDVKGLTLLVTPLLGAALEGVKVGGQH